MSVENKDTDKEKEKNEIPFKRLKSDENRDSKIITDNEHRNKAKIEIGFKYYVLRSLGLIFFSAGFSGAFFITSYVVVNSNGIWGTYNGDKFNTGLGIVICIVLFFIGILLIYYVKDLIDKKIYEYKNPKKESQDNENLYKDSFEVLSDINIDYLNKYYEQTYNQCDKSFTTAKVASNVSYIILALGIVLFFLSTFILKEDKSRLIMFGITTGTGVVIKLISSLYFYMYNTSVKKISEYHDKLYAIQNILISLELSNQITDSIKKDDIKADMIKRLLDSHKIHDNH